MQTLALDERALRRKKRILLLFLVLGLLTLIMGVGLFAYYPNVGIPPGLIKIGPPPLPMGKAPLPSPTPSATRPSPWPSPAPPATTGPVPRPSPTPMPFAPPPPAPLEVGPLNSGTWNVNVYNLMPGDTISRLVTVQDGGNADLINYRLVVTSATSNALTTDTVSGLQLLVERCTSPWIFGGAGSALSARCPGTASVVAPRSALLGNPSLAANAFCSSRQQVHPRGCTLTDKDYLRLTMSVPGGAGNLLQGLNANVTFTFSASGG